LGTFDIPYFTIPYKEKNCDIFHFWCSIFLYREPSSYKEDNVHFILTLDKEGTTFEKVNAYVEISLLDVENREERKILSQPQGTYQPGRGIISRAEESHESLNSCEDWLMQGSVANWPKFLSLSSKGLIKI
jgi:hypothetical protein